MKPSGDPVAARNSAKRKRSDETEEFNANGAAKAKFDETADKLGALVAKRLKSDGSSYRKTIADLEQKIKHLKAKIYDANEQLDKSRKGSNVSELCAECAEKGEVGTKMLSIKAHLDVAQKQHEETKKELAERMADFSLLMVENGGLRVDLDTLQSEHLTLKADYTELKQHLECMFSVSPEQYNHLAQQKAAAEEALQKATATVQQVLADKDSVVAAFDRLKQMNTSIMTATTTLKSDKAALTEQVAQLAARLKEQASEHAAQLDVYVEEAAKRINKLEAELEMERCKVAEYAHTSVPTGGSTSVVSKNQTMTDIVSNGGDCIAAHHTSTPTKASRASERTPPATPPPPQHTARMPTFTRVYVSNVLPEVNAEQVLLMIRLYGEVLMVEQLSNTSYVVQYAEADAAHLAVNYLDGLEVEGAVITCAPYTEPVPRTSETVTNYSAESATCTINAISPKVRPSPCTTQTPPLCNTKSRQVFVQHHAPLESRWSAEETEQELSKFGSIKRFKTIMGGVSYVARYNDKCSRDEALQKLPSQVNGYSLICGPSFQSLAQGAQRIAEDDPSFCSGSRLRYEFGQSVLACAAADPSPTARSPHGTIFSSSTEDNMTSTSAPAKKSAGVVLQENCGVGEERRVAYTSTKLYIGNVLEGVNAEQVLGLVEQLGSVVYQRKLSIKSYVVEYADPQEASSAAQVLNGFDVGGVRIACRPYTESAVTAGSEEAASVTEAVPTTPVKAHQLCVYILHHAPPKFKMTEDIVEREMSRFGNVKKTKLVVKSDSYAVQFHDKSSAERALQNFPKRINGFRVTRACNHAELVRKAAKVMEKINSNISRKQEVVETAETRIGRGKPRRDMFCTHCDQEGRASVVTTHNIDRCFYMPKKNESS